MLKRKILTAVKDTFLKMKLSLKSTEVQLPVVLERANVFQKKGIDTSKYSITLAHGLSLDVDDPVDVALAYREKMV
ncbi:hypothetical protein Tco_0801411 [Tanacetum coccineum]|uniref:Uncharacterized protein n=1 Tax=Tanacetum coccineum TaxID=301880 RepID=A0ABQ5A045_9ASTR